MFNKTILSLLLTVVSQFASAIPYEESSIEVLSSSCRSSAAFGQSWNNFHLRLRSPLSSPISKVEAIFIDSDDKELVQTARLAAGQSANTILWDLFANLEKRPYHFSITYTLTDGGQLVDDNQGELYELDPNCGNRIYADEDIVLKKIMNIPYSEEFLVEILVKNSDQKAEINLHLAGYEEKLFPLEKTYSPYSETLEDGDFAKVETWIVSIRRDELVSDNPQFFLSYHSEDGLNFARNAGENYLFPVLN